MADWTISKHVMRQTENTDDLPAPLRECVHEYGYAIVNACLQCGVWKPNQIHQLVKEIWDGARQPQQKTGRGQNLTLKKLDWLLIQAGAQIGAKQLVRHLAMHNFILISEQPTAEMVDASLAEVSGYNVRVTKSEKHRRRLAAAIRAAKADLFPTEQVEAA